MGRVSKPRGGFRRARGAAVRLAALALALVAAAPAPPALGADPLGLSQAINIAGRQRMLTQRIVKNYYLVGIGIDVERTRDALVDAVTLFEAQLAELRRHHQEPGVVAALDRVEKLWPDFAHIAGAAVERGQARRLIELGEALLAAADNVVLELEALSQRPYARLVNISGRQRMLSQRMVTLYLVQAWGLGNVATLDKLDRARNEFRGALIELQSSPENSDVIERELTAAGEQWQWLESALRFNQQDTFFPSIVDDAAEKTLVAMERVTALYTRLYDMRAGSESNAQ